MTFCRPGVAGATEREESRSLFAWAGPCRRTAQLQLVPNRYTQPDVRTHGPPRKDAFSMSGMRGQESDVSSKWLEDLSRNHRRYRERLAHELCRTFRSYRLSASEAEDLADLALAKAVANIGQFDSRRNAKFTTWLHRIARLCALDFVQSAERRRVTENVDDEKTRQRMPSVAGPAESYEQARLAERLQAAVAALPKGRRDAIRLCEFEGFSHEAAAAELGVPLRRLRQWLYEGRAMLGRNPELRRLYYGCDFSRKEARSHKSRDRGDDGVRG